MILRIVQKSLNWKGEGEGNKGWLRQGGKYLRQGVVVEAVEVVDSVEVVLGVW